MANDSLNGDSGAGTLLAMKICPACHQETFDGRAACHRCGSDVAAQRPIALPSRDAATLVGPVPFTDHQGDLVLDVDGVTFLRENGRPLLHIPVSSVEHVRPSRGRDLVIKWKPPNRRRARRTRLRVRWAPQADRTLRTEWVGSHYALRRPYGHRVPRNPNRRTGRDYTVVRDRWLSALSMLLNADRYTLSRW